MKHFEKQNAHMHGHSHFLKCLLSFKFCSPMIPGGYNGIIEKKLSIFMLCKAQEGRLDSTH
jgi:hypothetical protein